MTENTKETETHAPESGGGTGAPDGGAGGPPMDDGEGSEAAGDASEADAQAGAGADAGAGGAEDTRAADRDAGAPARKPRAGELRRLNENIEQLIDEMSGLEVEGDKAGALLALLTGLRAWKPDTSDVGIPRTAVPVGAADMHRWIETDRRRRRRWYGLAAAAAAPAALLLGLLVQQQFQVIPLHDPSGGWSGWIWETHGRAIVDCAVEARRTNAEVNCGLAVRRP